MKIVDKNGQLKTSAVGGGSSGSGFTASTQAEMETATSITTGVTPGRQQYHPSSAKVWGSFNGSGTPAILAGYNFSSITDGGAGVWTVNFTTAFSSANYAVIAMQIYINGIYYGNFMTHSTKTTGGVVLYCTSGGNTGQDATDINFACFGDQ